MRTGKQLLIASKNFAEEQRGRSWWCLWSALIPLAALLVVVCSPLPWWVTVPGSVLFGLTLVRMFIIYHDFMHGAILRDSRLAKVILYAYGLWSLNPPNHWKHSHDDHHKNNSKEFGPAVGSFPTLTVQGYAQASASQKLVYRVIRHPLTMACGYLTTFFLATCLVPFLRSPRKNADAGLAILVHVGFGVALALISVQALILGLLLPVTIAGALGTYLFYAQHNFPGIQRLEADDWDQVSAALHSSSYMSMGPVMNWFTGNIGYHHVHHLNSKIPFYRLPEAMAAMPELQSPHSTSLNPIEVGRCLRLKLWDPMSQQLVSFRHWRALATAAR